MAKIGFVTNVCPHYRVRTFEILSKLRDVDFYFFSAGNEWYFQKSNKTHDGAFHTVYAPAPDRSMPRRAWEIVRLLWRRRYDVVVKCVNNPLIVLATYITARLQRIPFVLWTGIWMRMNTRAHRLAWPFTQYLYRHADALVVYGAHVRDFLIHEGVSEERIFLAPNAVDNQIYTTPIDEQEKEAVRMRFDVASDRRIILFIGRLEDGKGLDYLIDAFRATAAVCSDAILLIAGDGSQRSALEARASEHGIADRVRFVGHVPVRETVQLYAVATAYALPSVTTPLFKEPWGLVVNEAFGQGVPVIATTSVGAVAGGMVRDGENGLVVPERDAERLSDAMVRILRDDDLRRRLSACARTTVDDWSQARMAQGFSDAIRFVLEGDAVK